MIRSRDKQSDNSFDGLIQSSKIVVLSGNPRQIFTPIPAPGSWEDDHRLVPLVLGGHVSVADPASIMSGDATLSGIEWYTQMPIEGDYATGRISNPSTIPTAAESYRQIDYLISDGSGAAWCSGVQRDCLIIHKNIPAGTGQTIFGVLKFIDRRTGDEKRVLRSFPIGTSGFDNESVVLKGPEPSEIMIDALAVPDTVPSGKTVLDIPWTRTVAVQLDGAEGDVPDGEACYLWTIQDGGNYREFTAAEADILNIQGQKAKVLTLDARMVVGTLSLRCYACRREEGAAWIDPRNADNPVYDCRVTQSMNNNITADPVQKAGALQDPLMTKRCLYDLDIRYGGKPVPNIKKCLFRVNWFTVGRVTRNGSTVHVKNDMGWGHDMSFVPSEKGYTYAAGYSVHAEVLTFAGCRPVVLGGTTVREETSQQNSNCVTRDGRLVIVPTYK